MTTYISIDAVALKKKKLKKVKKRQKRKKTPTQQTTDVDQSVSVFYKRAV
jgi:predicted RNA-binding protein YlxR (DUF448 family)